MSLDDIQIEPDAQRLAQLAQEVEAGQFNVSELGEKGWAEAASNALSSAAELNLTPEQTEAFESELGTLVDQGDLTAAQQQQINGLIDALTLAEENAPQTTSFIAQNIVDTLAPNLPQTTQEGAPFDQEALLAPFEAIANAPDASEGVDAALAESISRRLAEVMVADLALGGALSTQVADLQSMISAIKSGQPVPPGLLETTFNSIQSAVYTASTGGSLSSSDQAAAQRQTAQAIEELLVAERYALSTEQAHYVAQLDSEYLQESAAHYINELGMEANQAVYQLDTMSDVFRKSGLDLDIPSNQGLFNESNNAVIDAAKQGGTLDITMDVNAETSAEVERAYEQNRETATAALEKIQKNNPSNMLQAALAERKKWGFTDDFSTIETTLLDDFASGNITEEEFIERQNTITNSLKAGALAIDKEIFDTFEPEVQQHLLSLAEEKGITLFEDGSLSELMSKAERDQAFKRLFETQEFQDVLGDRDFSELNPSEKHEVISSALEVVTDPQIKLDAQTAVAVTASEFGKSATHDAMEGLYQHHISQGLSHEQATAQTEIDMLVLANGDRPRAVNAVLQRSGMSEEQAAATNAYISENGGIDVGDETVRGLVRSTVGAKAIIDQEKYTTTYQQLADSRNAARDAVALLKDKDPEDINYGEAARIHKIIEANPDVARMYGINDELDQLNTIFGVAQNEISLGGTQDEIWEGPSDEEINELALHQEHNARIEGRAALIQFNAEPAKYGPDSDVFRQASEFEMQLREESAMRRDPSLRMDNGSIHPTKFTEIYDSVEATFNQRYETARLEQTQAFLEMEPEGKAKVEVTEGGLVVIEGNSLTGRGGQSIAAVDDLTTDSLLRAREAGLALQSTIPVDPALNTGGMSTPADSSLGLDDATLSSLGANLGVASPVTSSPAANSPATAAEAAPETPIAVADAGPASTPPPPLATPNVLPQIDPGVTGPA